MKKILVGLALIAAVIGVAPKYIGAEVEKAVQAQVVRLDTMPGYIASVTQYDRGWFTSSAVVNIAYDTAMLGMNALNAEEELVLNEEALAALAAFEQGLSFDLAISHGLVILERAPGLAISDISVTLSDSQDEDLQTFLSQINESYTTDELFVTTIRTALLGESHYSSVVPSISFDDDNIQVRYSGLNVSGASLGDQDGYTMEGTLGALNFSSPDATFTMSEMMIDGEWAWLGSSWLSVGKSALQLDTMAFTVNSIVEDGAEPAGFTVNGLQLKADVTPSGDDTLAMILDTDIQEIIVQEHTVSNIDYDFTIKNLSQSAFIAFYDELEVLNGMTELDADAIARLTALASEFASAGPELHIDKLGYQLNDVNFLDLSGQIVLDADLATAAIDSGNTAALMPALSSEVTVELGESLLAIVQTEVLKKQLAAAGLEPEQEAQIMAQQQAQLPMMTQQFIEQGLLEKIERGFRIKAAFQNGQVSVNGNPVPLF